MRHTRWLVDFDKLAEHTGKEDVVMLWFLANFCEPVDALYGDLDVSFTKTDEGARYLCW